MVLSIISLFFSHIALIPDILKLIPNPILKDIGSKNQSLDNRRVSSDDTNNSVQNHNTPCKINIINLQNCINNTQSNSIYFIYCIQYRQEVQLKHNHINLINVQVKRCMFLLFFMIHFENALKLMQSK